MAHSIKYNIRPKPKINDPHKSLLLAFAYDFFNANGIIFFLKRPKAAFFSGTLVMYDAEFWCESKFSMAQLEATL